MKNRTLPSLERRFIILFVVLILSLSGMGAYFSRYFAPCRRKIYASSTTAVLP